MKTVQVLGTRCPRFAMLAANAELAVREERIEGQVVKVGEIAEMLAFDESRPCRHWPSTAGWFLRSRPQRPSDPGNPPVLAFLESEWT